MRNLRVSYGGKEANIFAFSIDYYAIIGGFNKYIGSVVRQIEEVPEKRKYSYEGREKFLLNETIELDNKKILKKGIEVTTELTPLIGKYSPIK